MASSQLPLLLPLLLLSILLFNHPVQCYGMNSSIYILFFVDSTRRYCCFHLAFPTWIHLGLNLGKMGFSVLTLIDALSFLRIFVFQDVWWFVWCFFSFVLLIWSWISALWCFVFFLLRNMFFFFFCWKPNSEEIWIQGIKLSVIIYEKL